MFAQRKQEPTKVILCEHENYHIKDPPLPELYVIIYYHLFSEVIIMPFRLRACWLRAASLLPVGPQVGDEQQDVIDRSRERVDGRDDVEDEENEENGFDSAVIHGMDLL